jgi:hypothetical protein
LHGGDFGVRYPSRKAINPERTLANLTEMPTL